MADFLPFRRNALISLWHNMLRGVTAYSCCHRAHFDLPISLIDGADEP